MKLPDLRDHIRELRIRGRHRRQQPGLQLGIGDVQEPFEAIEIATGHGWQDFEGKAPNQEIELLGAPVPRAPSRTAAPDLDIVAHDQKTVLDGRAALCFTRHEVSYNALSGPCQPGRWRSAAHVAAGRGTPPPDARN